MFDVRGHKRTNSCAQQIVHDKLTRTSTICHRCVDTLINKLCTFVDLREFDSVKSTGCSCEGEEEV